MALNNTRTKARDARRLSDIKTITTGLEMYYSDFGLYPLVPIPTGTPITNLCLSNIGITSTCGATIYSSKLPGDPITGRSYIYEPIDGGSYYTLAFALETGSSNYIKGDYTATPAGIIPWVCGVNTVTFNYNNIPVTYGAVLNTTTNECWLDRNLGAARVAQASNDYLAYGDLFQWGRPADGHQLINWALGAPVNGNQLGQVANVVPGTVTFIVSNDDWSSIDGTGSIRQVNWGVAGISNPCPAGFRVPTAAELIAEKNSWISQNLTGAFASPLKLTTAGARGSSGSSIYGTGYMGFYWSSAVDGSRSVVFQFDNSNANTGNYTRAIGLLIRCIKD